MLKKNILANLFGNILTAIVSILCIPVYVHYLGVEAYGLIGIFASLQVIFSVLDMGLSATLNREFARLSINESGATEQKNLLRTFEYIYFGIAVFIGLVISFSASLISSHWLSAKSISPQTVKFVLIQMGILLALRFPNALYAGGLTGLQKQILYNTINTAGEFVKALGAVIVLAFVSNSIIAFFYWQIIITAIIVAILNFFLWKKLHSVDGKPLFSKALILKNKSFAAGMGGTSLAVIILTQTDKVILSKILDLKTFGYFILASAITSSLYRIIVPVSQAVYPRMVQLVHSHKQTESIQLFHIACQFIASIVLPIAITLCFFSKEIIMLWTHDATITTAVYPLVRILIIGTACNALVTIPYMQQLAYGWTKLGLYQNIIATIILIPSIIYFTNMYGAYGAVWCWTALNACYIIFSMPVMFKKYLKTEQWKWYLNDIIKPLFYTVMIMLTARLVLNYLFIKSDILLITYIAFFSLLCFFVVLYLTPNIRAKLLLLLNRQKYFNARF